MHLPEIISGVSALAAIFSAVRAWSSARSAAKSYALALQQEHARKPNLDVYLVEGEKLAAKGDNRRSYRFHVRITNQAQAANTLVEMLLEIDYSRGATEGLRIQLPTAQADDMSQPGIGLPRLLQPKEAVVGWVAFDIPGDLLAGARADTYRIVFLDATNTRYEIRPIIITERET